MKVTNPTFIILFLLLFLPLVYSINYENYQKYYNLSFSCTHNAYLETQHPTTNQNCTELYDGVASAFTTNNTSPTYVYLNFSFTDTFYSLRDWSFNTETANVQWNLKPEWIEIYINGINRSGHWVDIYKNTLGCGASSINWYVRNFNDTSLDIPEGFNFIQFKIKAPVDDACLTDKRYRFGDFNFSLSDTNSSNQLPSANISTTYDVCLNSTVSGVFNLTIDSYDSEGDTIYYGLQKDASYMIDRYISFDKYASSIEEVGYVQLAHGLLCRSFLSILGLCTNYEEYGISVKYPKPEDLDTDCTIMDNINYASQFNRSIFYAFEESNGYKLAWNISKCDNKRLSIFNSQTKYNESLYSLSYMIQPLNNTVFIVNPSYDNFFTSIDPITINRTAGKTYFSFSTNRFNTSTAKIEVRTLINYDANSYTLNLYDYSSYFDSNPIYTSTKTLLGDNYPYVSINGVKGLMYLDDIIFWRENSSVTFSTTKPESIKFTKTGTFFNTLYISDEVHQPDEYTTIPFILRVDECKYTTQGIANQNEYGDLARNFDLIGFFNVLLGKPFRYYMGEVDENNIAQSILWWVYLFLFFGLFIFNYFNQKTADLIIPLVISSLIILVISILGGYTSSLIVSLIGLAFGIGIPLSSSIGGQNGR
jgi:hypothetical protein